MKLCQRRTHIPMLPRAWFTAAQKRVAAVGLSLLLPLMGATNAFAQMHQDDSRTVRIPVVDGDDIRFTRLSTAQGLSNTRVSQIVQDDKGFMWFGTEYGLNRYDGYNFKVFTHDPAEDNSLSCVFIHSLFKDRSGALWIGCDHFLDRLEPTTETFTHYRIDSGAPGEIANPVENISQDRNGTLWLATGKGLFSLNSETGKLVRYAHDPKDDWTLSSRRIRCTLEDRAGRFWVANGDNLAEFDRRSGKILFRVKLDDGIEEAVLFEDHRGELWVAYVTDERGSGLAIMDRSTNRLVRYSLYDGKTRRPLYGGVRAIAEDHNGTLWLATFGEPLLKFDRDNGVLIRYQNHHDDPNSIAEDRANVLYADRVGNVWVGLHATAPNFFHVGGSSFTPLPIDKSDPRGFGETLVSALDEDREGKLWIATAGRLNRVDLISGRSISYRVPPDPGLRSDIIAITDDRGGSIWLGTYGKGAIKVDLSTGRFTSYLHDRKRPDSISSNIVFRLLIDRSGTMWLATYNGLDRFDSRNETFRTYKEDSGSDAEAYFNLTEDKNGFLWMGSSRGLTRFDPKSGQFNTYRYRAGDPGSLSDTFVTSVLMTHAGATWVGTANGLDTLDSDTGTFTRYFVKDGLPSNLMSCLLEDDSSMLWMSTSHGLSKFDPSTRLFTNYSVADGLPGNDLSGWGACFKSPSGQMFFGGFSGGVAFYPSKINNTSYTAPLVLTDFQVNGSAVRAAPTSPLSGSIIQGTDIRLTHDQYVFSFAFAALTFFNPDSNRYRYKLDGIDHDWVEVGSDRRVATYTTLPAGRYTFRVQTATRQSNWNEPGLALKITVLPPWWGTWWFRLMFVGALIGLLWAFYLARLRQVGAEIRARIEERLGERDRIARELHDTLLQGMQGLVLRFQGVAEQIPASSPARQAIEKALDRTDEVLAEGRDRVNNLRIASQERALPDALNDAIKDLSIGEGVECRVVVEGKPRDLHPLVRDEIYWIAREALANALRHARASVIEIEIGYDSAQFRMRLRDDGCGIDSKIIEAGGKPGHWGMRGMRERAARSCGRLETWSKPGVGTELELKIPGSNAYAIRANGSHWRRLRQFWREETMQ